MNEELELKVQAWIDRELSAVDSARMAQLIAAEPEAGQLAAELRGVKAALAGAEMTRTVPDGREFYWSKIQRQIEFEKRPTPAPRQGLMARWRRFLMPLAGLATAACVATFTLTQSKAVTDDAFTSTDEAMETTTFSDQSAGMTVVWLQDRDTSLPAAAAPAKQVDDITVTD